MKEIGLVNYPGRPHRQRSPISLKSVMVSCAIEKAYCEESAEVIVGVSPTPKDLMFI